MNLKFFILILLIPFYNDIVFSQYNMTTNNGQTVTVNNCTGILTDNVSGNYTSGATQTITIQSPNDGEGVCLDFTLWDLDPWTGSHYPDMDYVNFYDGAATTSPLIYGATGAWVADPSGSPFDFSGPGMVCSSGGALTIQFKRRWGGRAGFSAKISCLIPPPTNACNINITADISSICPSESVLLSANGELSSLLLNNNFNNSQNGNGWESSINSRFDNPCGSGIDGTPHFWVGVNSSPRTFTSIPFNLTLGGSIYFEIDFAEQDGAKPCEGPDEATEGVYLQYSTNGTTWVTVHYFFPKYYIEGSDNIQSWQGYFYEIPAAARTANTRFRWIQNDVSGDETDHWGLDNIKIVAPNPITITIREGSPTGTILETSNTSPISTTVSPSTTTTYYAVITDGTSSCASPITINVTPGPIPPTVTNVSYCQDAPAIALSASPIAGNTLNWYGTNATGGTASSIPTPSTGTVGSVIYYVSQITPTGCESTRAPLTVTVSPTITPTFTAVPAICSGGTISALPTTSNNAINGAWSPSIDNTATTIYTFTPTTGQCSNTTTLTITVNPTITPIFTAVTAICSGGTIATLPTTSNNAINGVWSPNLDNTATTIYTFAPTTGQCANTTTLTITVNPTITPTFTAVPAICSGGTISALPTTSNNAINGAWSPSIDNTATTIYTFTPTTAQCANTSTLTITVNPPITPTFTAVPAICSGGTISALPTTSNNAINGAWSPSIDNTATTIYTFTPTTGQCANTTTLTISVNSLGTIPTFTSMPAICSGETISALPTTSNNSITGSWSPTLNNTATTMYTFTPTTGQCANTTTLTITVTPTITPTFTAVPAICSGGTISPLPTTSNDAINGAWSPSLDNTTTTIYTFTPTIGQCANTTTLTITVNTSSSIPTFTAVPAICSGGTISALPTTSNNAINGAWSPSIDNTATTNYTFTPTTGQCANTTTLTITVNPTITPTFTAVPAICSGGTISALPTTSNNAINGAWSPSIDNTATTIYTFTPTTAQCANTSTLTITVNPPITPTFTAVPAICSGGTISPLPTTSNNAINGVWSPSIDNTTTTIYTFTPTIGQCANTTNLTITVNNTSSIPTFTAVPAICSGGTISPLPTTSNNAINGAWSPSLDNTATTIYTFTPTTGQCANTTTLTITVNPIITPTFTAVPAICSGGTITALPTTSNNTINGAWSPSINNTATTTYTFTPTTVQCANTTTLTITVDPIPTPPITSPVSYCLNTVVSPLSATASSGNTLNWYGNNAIGGVGSINAPIPSTSIVGASTYYVSQTNNLTTCESSRSSLVVTINTNPTISVSPVTICNGEMATLIATGGSIYSWGQGATNNPYNVFPGATTTYSLTGIDANFCIGTTTVTVTVKPIPAIAFVDSLTICSPEKIDLTNPSRSLGSSQGSVFSYYSDFLLNSTLTNASEVESGGVYYIQGYLNGCKSIVDSVVVTINNKPIAEFTPLPAIVSTFNPISTMRNESEGASNYIWEFGDGNISTLTNPTDTFPDTDTATYLISLVALTEYGCSDTITKKLNVFEELLYYIPNTFTPDNDQYNNTFQPIFVSGYDPYSFTMYIFNRWGEVVFESHDSNVGWKGTYGLTDEIATEGAYTWKILFSLKSDDHKKQATGLVNLIK